MNFLTYECALEGDRRPPITVTLHDLGESRTLSASRQGHHFTLEVEPRTRDVYCVYDIAWGRSGFERARVHVGTGARFH